MYALRGVYTQTRITHVLSIVHSLLFTFIHSVRSLNVSYSYNPSLVEDLLPFSATQETYAI